MLVFVITSWTFDTAATPDTSNTRNCLQDCSEWTRSSAKSNRMVCIVKQGRKSREFFFFSLCFHFFVLWLVLCHFSVSESSLPSSSLLPLHKNAHTHTHRHCNAAYWPSNVSEQNLKTIMSIALSYFKKKFPKFHMQNLLSVCHVQVQKKRFHSNELFNEFVYRWTETKTVHYLWL